MSADTAAFLLILFIAPAATAFPICLAWLSRGVWYRNMTGRALMTSSIGLALLVDISLAYQLLGDNYALRDAVRLTVFSVVAAGAWQKLVALLWESRRTTTEEDA